MIDVDVDLATGIATVTLNRPPVNALTVEMCGQIQKVFAELSGAQSTRCVILAGAGTRAFCAGLDFKEFFASTADESVRALIVRNMYLAVYTCAAPVIAAVEGPALGAGSVLASVCDIRLAAQAATFGLPEINVGRIGGAAHHGRLIPQGLLRRMVFTGVPISSAEAHRVGFVQDLVSADALAAARTLASVIAAKSVVGVRHAKLSLNEIEHLTVDDGYEREQVRSARLRETEDAQEASRAVMEKRSPVFTGR